MRVCVGIYQGQYGKVGRWTRGRSREYRGLRRINRDKGKLSREKQTTRGRRRIREKRSKKKRETHEGRIN